MKSKYPRYFIDSSDPELLYMKICKMWGPVYYITRSGKIFDSSYTERGCDDYVKNGDWREISEDEVALL